MYMPCMLHSQLEQLHAENSVTVRGLWERVRMLWDRVEMSKEDRDAFQSQTSGVSQRVILSVSILSHLFKRLISDDSSVWLLTSYWLLIIHSY